MSETPQSIGRAECLPDGTIELLLRAETPNGAIGEARFTYAPSDPRYQGLVEHLGGIEVGQVKSVPPFPD